MLKVLKKPAIRLSAITTIDFYSYEVANGHNIIFGKLVIIIVKHFDFNYLNPNVYSLMKLILTYTIF